MKRYVTRSRYSEQLYEEVIDIGNAYTVYEPDRKSVRTGLLDASGNELYSVEEMDPIGFIRPKRD